MRSLVKVTIPDFEIEDGVGFNPETDIFNRSEFGERLANLIENSDDNPVIALDSGWGEGKTTFVKMWINHINHSREDKLLSIYFDAFENDYQKEPFLSLASEIYQLIEPEDKTKKELFREKTSNALGPVFKLDLVDLSLIS